MRFIMNQKELEKNLDIASHVVSKKIINPSLQGTLVSIENSKIHMQASDGEVFIRITSDLESAGDGKILVKSSLLRDIVKTLGTNSSVDIEEIDNSIKIQTSSSKRKTIINLLALEDLIEFPDILNTEFLASLNAIEFKDMINKTLPFAAKEEIRFTFNSLLIQKDAIELRVVSSDTKRLAFTKQYLSEESGDFSILIPSKTGQILKDMITSQDPIEISKNKDGLIIFKYKNIILVSPEVDGMFPDYRAVIPKETPSIIEVDKNLLSDTLKGFQPFYSNADSQKILLKMQKNLLTLSTDETEVGADENQLDVNFSGESFTVAFNFNFLKDILQYISEDTVQIKVLSADKPVIFAGKDNQLSLFVCVPMKLS